MRASVVACLTASLFTYAAAAEPFPYIVHVAGEQAVLRGGPGEDYYATAALARGTPLEVWRHAPDGWLAVRPPKGAYSLVAAEDVRLAPNRLAEVVRPDAPARIGSELTAERDVVQVLLAQGEHVQVLETVTLDGQFWHRIVPPSGEFRWIHTDLVSGPAATAAEQVAQTFVPAEAEPGPYRIARYSAAEQREVTPADSDDGPAHGPRQTLADLVGRKEPVESEPPITPAEIEVELATIVAEEPRLWHFAHLRKRCRELMESSNAAQKGQLEVVLEKIARFEQIRDRKRAIVRDQPVETKRAPEAASREEVAPIEEPPAAKAEPVQLAASEATWRPAREPRELPPRENGSSEAVRIAEDSSQAGIDASRYDGIGTLRPVVSRRTEAPRYALVDGEGDVVTFVTPSPGVNLQPYVGQRIGIVGTRGYMPEFKRTHVTAARVTPLR